MPTRTRRCSGILALLHGASSREVRHLRAGDIDETARTARLGSRPRPVPLDPASWQVLQRCLAHREAQRTATRSDGHQGHQGRAVAGLGRLWSHLLDRCGVPPRSLRCTRLADLVNTIDPKLVAAAFGMRPEGVMFYLADHVDQARLPLRRDTRHRSPHARGSMLVGKHAPAAQQ